MLMNLSLIKILSIEFRKEWNYQNKHLEASKPNTDAQKPDNILVYKTNVPVVEEVFWLPESYSFRKVHYKCRSVEISSLCAGINLL